MLSGFTAIAALSKSYPPELQEQFKKDCLAILWRDRSYTLSQVQMALSNISTIRSEIDQILKGEELDCLKE